MDQFSNASSFNSSSLNEQERACFFGFVSALIVLLVPAQLILNTVVLTGLCISESFRRIPAQRNYLIGLVCMSYVTSLGIVLYAVAEFLFLTECNTAATVFCHLASWLAQVDLTVRDVFLSFFCVTVFIILKRESEKINLYHSYLVLFVLCLLALLFTLVFLVPQAIDFSSQANGVLCVPTVHETGKAGLAVLGIVFRLPAHTVLIIIAIASCMLTKRYSLAGHRDIEVAAVKISVIIASINTLFIIQALTLVILLSIRPLKDSIENISVLHVLYYILPIIPTFINPLLMIAVFKPLRLQLVPKCCCHRMGHSDTQTAENSNYCSYSNSSVHYRECVL